MNGMAYLCQFGLLMAKVEARKASVDTHPKGEDAKQASALLSSAVAKPDAQTPPPSPNGENNG